MANASITTRRSGRLAALQGEHDRAQIEATDSNLLHQGDPIAALQVSSIVIMRQTVVRAYTHTASFQLHVSKTVEIAQALKRNYQKLQGQNEELAAELADIKQQLEENSQPRRGHRGQAPTVQQLQRQIVRLKLRVNELEKVQEYGSPPTLL